MTFATEFYICFIRELFSSLTHNYRDNFVGKLSLRQTAKELLKGILYRYGFHRIDSDMVSRFLKNHRQLEDFEYLYSLLDDPESRELLIKIILYRLLGHNKVRLQRKEARITQLMDESYTYADPCDTLPFNFMNWNLIKFDLNKINYPIILYNLPKGIVEQFILRQYVYQTAEVSVKPEYGDIILDCGACFGETALFLAHESGDKGKVYSFEFIKGNIQIYKKNISLNPELERRLSLIEQPVWETSGCCLYYNDNGPASKVGFEKFGGAEDQTITISIDEMVIRHGLEKVDFIKMDLEGAELSALKGAIQTLKKYKPKLAISIYHNLDHFKSIPEFIKSISPEYRLYLGHYTIHTEETILYAICNPNVA